MFRQALRGARFLHYGFRNKNGKAIVAYWVAAHSNPGGAFAPLTVSLKLKNSGIQEAGVDRCRIG